MKIVSIIGARPQFIKCAALTRELRKDHNEVIVHTGQHYDANLSDIFFDELKIPQPDYNLGIGSGTHGYQVGRMLMAIEDVLMKEKPEMTLVYGDTNSTLAGAIVASRLHISLGHVEAGLRCLDKGMPEETNRILADHCSDILFCPTKISVNNLWNENIRKRVYQTGDVMVDILLKNIQIAEKSDILEAVDLKSKQYIVVTIHREGNTNTKKKLQNIVDALCEIDQTTVFPMHPRTIKALHEFGLYDRLKENNRIKILTPLSYLDFHKLMNHAKIIITDSGGVQKEAYVLKVPCITLLETTPWEETIEDGWNVLVGTDTEKILDMVKNFKPRGKQTEDFGKGRACKNIINALVLG